MGKVCLEFFVALGIYFLPLGTVILFIVRLIQFIVCEYGFESEERKKRAVFTGLLAGILVIIWLLLRSSSNALFWVG